MIIEERLRHMLLAAGYHFADSLVASAVDSYRALTFTRGHGALKSSFILIVPRCKLNEVNAAEFAIGVERDLDGLVGPFDKILILAPIAYSSGSERVDFVTLSALCLSLLPVSRLLRDWRGPNFLGGRFLERRVIADMSDFPILLDVALAQTIKDGAQLVALVGPLGGGKSTALTTFIYATDFLKVLDVGGLAFPIDGFIESGEESSLPLSDGTCWEGQAIVHVADFDECWFRHGPAVTLRRLRNFIDTGLRQFSRPVFVVSLSANPENVSQIIGSACSDVVEPSKVAILQILPLDVKSIRGAVKRELGSKHGDLWWDIISRSQEIAQIAEWPSGLASLMESVFSYSWNNPRPSQSDVIGALIDTLVGRAQANGIWVATPNVRAFMMELAYEMNAAQDLSVPISRAHFVARRLGIIGDSSHRPTPRELIVPGLVALDVKSGSLVFENLIFFHYFLAAAVQSAVERSDVTETSSLFHRRLPVAVLSDAIEFGIQEETVWSLIRATAQLPGGDSGFVGGNAASLLRLLGASFREREFTCCDLRGAILVGCDLTGADFSQTSLVEAGLANVTLDGANFRGADLQAADLKSGCMIYQVAAWGHGAYLATSARGLAFHSLKPQPGGQLTEVTGFRDSVFAVAVSPTMRLLIAGGQDSTVRGWALHSLEPAFILRGHLGDVRSLGFFGNWVLSCAVDGRLNVWEPNTRALVRSIKVCGGALWSFVPRGPESVAVLCDHGHLHHVNLRTGVEEAAHNVPGNYTKRVLSARANDVIIGGEEFVWMQGSHAKEATVQEVPGIAVRVVAALDDGRYLLGGSYGRIVETDGRFRVTQTLEMQGKDYISDICAIEGGKWLVSDASGGLFTIRRREGKWHTVDRFEISSAARLSAKGANFQDARHIPQERRDRLIEAGATF